MDEGEDSLYVEGAPAYDVSGSQRGPSCSGHPDFCYFCAFQEASDACEDGEEDDCGALKGLVRSLAEQGKELPVIVNQVYALYDKHIRPNTTHTNPKTNKALSKPEWSRASIQRHLTFSTEFGCLFDRVVEQIFHGLITLQNAVVVEKNTGQVIEERRKSLIDTLSHFTRWRSINKSKTAGKRHLPPPKKIKFL